MTPELKKRILTSFLLFFILYIMHLYSFAMICLLIITGIICWIEAYGLIVKIFHKNDFKNRVKRFVLKAISLIYLSSLVFIIFYIKSIKPELQIFILYALSISIVSDIGGFTFGKVFKGKKLTKISPNKTISGAIGSFIFSMMLIPLFIDHYDNSSLLILSIITLIISLTSQLGDLLISYLKRRAKVKDTSDLLPGHGGFLDRLDGIIFAIPVGLILTNLVQ
tara:strand:+ start:608 stop:1273 length:666 start_codon:yes stop_codon:yes gene_type:complete